MTSKTYDSFKKGDDARVVGNRAGAGAQFIGTTVTVASVSTPNRSVSARSSTGGCRTYYWEDLEYISYGSEFIKEKVKVLKEEIKVYENQLSYMKESGTDKFDADEFKAYSILNTVDEKGLNNFEKAKKIALLFK